MRARTSGPRGLLTGRVALLVAPVAALAVACGSAAGVTSNGGPGGGTGGSGGSGNPTGGSGNPTGGSGNTSGGGTGGAASCAYLTQPAYLAQARVVFVGTTLPGRTVLDGLLVTPARIRVSRYLKGSGPAVVTVQTAASPSGTTMNGEGIMARAGQRWVVYTISRQQPYATDVCSGSCQLSAGR
ncbi:MAG TPA: hypothetical protein VH641_22250 [Streptosporangiaceae bacterium]